MNMYKVIYTGKKKFSSITINGVTIALDTNGIGRVSDSDAKKISNSKDLKIVKE